MILWLWQNLSYCLILSLGKADGTTGPFTLSTANFNRWAEDDKLRFLKVCLIGRAQSVIQRLSDDQKDTCEHAMEALHQCFKPASKRELYLTELFTRRRRPIECWANFANNLCRLSSKAYPELGQKATDQLALIVSALTVRKEKKSNSIHYEKSKQDGAWMAGKGAHCKAYYIQHNKRTKTLARIAYKIN